MGYTTATTITQGGGSGAGTIGLPGVAASFDPRHVSDNDGGAANDMIGCRVVVPTTGTLHDLTIYISTSAGNIDVGIYSTAATRARLYSTGSIACPAGGGWRNVGDPALAVTAGDQYDFCVAQSAGATFGSRRFTSSGVATLPVAYTLGQVGLAILSYTKGTSFPLPATFTEASVTASGIILCIMARVG